MWYPSISHKKTQPTERSMYIFIHWLTFSLYHNSSVWLDTRDTSSYDLNLSAFTSVGFLTPNLSSLSLKGKDFFTYICIYIYAYHIHIYLQTQRQYMRKHKKWKAENHQLIKSWIFAFGIDIKSEPRHLRSA